MLEVKKYSVTGEEAGTVKLPEALFGATANNPKAVIYEVINMYLANQRQGTSCVKNRAVVQGSGKKLFRQKGTGNARPGNLRTPVRVGGGVAFGPRPKDWYRPIPKKKKRLALKLALTERVKAGQVVVLESLHYDAPNTKAAKALLSKIAPERSKTLVIFDGSDASLVKSFSNIPYVKTDRADGLFAYEVLNSTFLVLTEDALTKMMEVFAK
ncbi:MAG: 50S ribosomal protein L4 [Candidatus Cloacimonetes bacterium]|nr:50S ribosomal protein L4 [Candidatus Cloacimonadota bacterium]